MHVVNAEEAVRNREGENKKQDSKVSVHPLPKLLGQSQTVLVQSCPLWPQ